MAYATQQDIADLYGEELLYVVADRDRNQVLDTVAIERALVLATGEINSKLANRHPVPFAEPSADIQRICIDLAVYRLALEADALTIEIKDRRKQAREDLLLMAQGEIGTGVELPPGSGSEIRDGEVLVSGNERIFTRTTMRGL